MRHNLRRGIHRGESSPRPAGWGTQPLRIQLRVCSRSNFRASLFTCRPSGALGYLVYCVCYKHVAPLGLNAAQFAARYPSWGEFSSPSGLGNPTPTDPTSLAHVGIHRGGEVLLAQRVGEPNPYGSNFACSRSNFRASLFTCRPSGAKCGTIFHRVLLAQRVGEPNPYYKLAVAPLGLNAAQFAARYPSWGEFSSPSGLGNPTPTDPTFLPSISQS